MLPAVSDVQVFRLKTIRDSRGELAVLEMCSTLPFHSSRLFYIRDVPTNSTRGMHAHRLCNQFMICQAGRINVRVDDGTSSRNFELVASDAILVPSVIYASETFLEEGSTLLVLCDRPYEPEDYLHSWDEYLRYRMSVAAGKV